MHRSKYLSAKDIDPLNLDKLPVFQELHIDDLENLLAVCQLQAYVAGENIIRTGTYDSWLYILLKGKASVIVDQTEVTVLHERGSLFGEAALIENSSRKADIIAQTDCECLRIDSVLMKEILCTTNMMFYAHFYKHITEMLSIRLAATSEELTLVKKAFDHFIEQDH